MVYKVAIIVDWENIRFRFFESREILNKLKDRNNKLSYNKHVRKLPYFFLEFLEKDEVPYRIFIYTAEPFKEVKERDGKLIDFRDSKITRKIEKFQKSLGSCELVAMRKGRMAFRGWKENGEPILVQKKVDMLMGLDMAHLAYKRLVDRILVFSYDLDLQPALKAARMEGIQVIIPALEELGIEDIPYDLLLHSDFVRFRSYEEICKKLLLQ